MKKLFGVAILAALPIACGTEPSAPTASFPEAAATPESFAASAKVAPMPTCSVRVDWSSVKGVVIGVARRSPGSATVRADLVILGGQAAPLPCHTKTFSVKPSGRGVTLEPGTDSREATLRAPDGVYEISVLAEGSGKPSYTASVMVEMPGK